MATGAARRDVRRPTTERRYCMKDREIWEVGMFLATLVVALILVPGALLTFWGGNDWAHFAKVAVSLGFVYLVYALFLRWLAFGGKED